MVPFYGIVWKDVNNYPITWNFESHSIRYRVHYPAITTDNLPWRLINNYSNLNLETYHEETETPFILDKEKHEFISYENERSIAKKVKRLSLYFKILRII
jgi:GH18 family chitinase